MKAMVLRRGRICTQKGSEKNVMIDQPGVKSCCGRIRKGNRNKIYLKVDLRQSQSDS